MESLEFWIWQHASKYGMTRVIKRMSSTNVFQFDMPNCWLSAQLLQRVKDEWDIPGKISSSELAAVQDCFYNLFKFYMNTVKLSIKIVDCIQLDLGCKAAFLALRLTNSDPWSWRRAKDEMFPEWNPQLWTKMKHNYELKNDRHKEEIRVCYLELRAKLQERNCKDAVLRHFQILMRKSFPVLIEYFLRMQLSVLEKIKLSSTDLDPELNFLPVLLKKGINDEVALLNLWEELQRRKGKKRTYFDSSNLRPPRTVGSPATDGTFCVVPPKATATTTAAQQALFPPCFAANPSMPSRYTMRNRDGTLEEIMIDKHVPRDVMGVASLTPHWFSDGSLAPLKLERGEADYPNCDKQNPVDTNSSHHAASTEDDNNLPEHSTDEPQLDPNQHGGGSCSAPSSEAITDTNLVASTKLTVATSEVDAGGDVCKQQRLMEVTVEGRRILPHLIETLQKQSQQLGFRNDDAVDHREELNQCLERILHSHKALSTMLEDADTLGVEFVR